MRRVFGLGETVFDIIFKNGQPVSAKAGGSVLNAMVSLARLGHQCCFISELGHDKVGDIIVDFLNQNNINSSYLQRYNHGQSALAMAFLNAQNDAEYDFYKNYPEERLTLPLPEFEEGDIFLFGSSYAVSPVIRRQVVKIAEHAKKCGCTIIYDPNIRKANKNNPSETLEFIKENMELADIVRASNEDLCNIFNTSNSEDSYAKVNPYCTNLIYSANAKGVYIHSNNFANHYSVPTIKTISTIGAGDNFNAGIIHGLLKLCLNKQSLAGLNENQWNQLADCGIQLATDVCMSMDNYINEGFTLSQ
ncbi:carbohydrate kinase family protein [Labilibacter marinus]|uniref:carbohydrate kinase family protein n=1 Tax=Labilibacter marinus TaxID=1477105 RepID=UPI00082D2361|nr:carbohydrate kinase [Labilibacter marinus]